MYFYLSQGVNMKYKAVIFDLFETLITEWGHKKYTKNEMCADLGIERKAFDIYWNEKESDRYTGDISFEESIRYVFEKTQNIIDNDVISKIIEKRINTKAVCFESVNPEIFCLLNKLKESGMKIAIISNCSSEEVKVLRESSLVKYFDDILLSYEVKMKKPDSCIYELAAKKLGVELCECVFVGDGGSNELEGAESVGMKAIQAKWYTNQLPHKSESIERFLIAEYPLRIIDYIN